MTRWRDVQYLADAAVGICFDLLVAHEGEWLGDNVYNNTGTGQTAQGTVRIGRVRVFKFRVINDRNEIDRCRITGPATVGPFTLQYATPKGANVTHRIIGEG